MLKATSIIFVCLCVGLIHSFSIGLPTNIVGGYKPDLSLLNNVQVQNWVGTAAEKWANAQNIMLEHLKVIKVETQLVAGTNYRITFTASPIDPSLGTQTTCEVVVYVRWDLTENIGDAQCNTQ